MNPDQPNGKTVLVVEDDPSLILGLELNLKRAGYIVRLARDGNAGIEAFDEKQPDLLILDLMLPGIDGLGILRHVRSQTQTVPVIILTALGNETDKVKGLDLGANDYVTKPFSIAELLARVRAALRSQHQGLTEIDDEQILRAGSIELHPEKRKVFVRGKEVELKSREYDVLIFLMKRPERVLTREQILSNVWGLHYIGTDRTVDNFVSSLRKKLGEDSEHPRHLRTVWGIGYRFVP